MTPLTVICRQAGMEADEEEGLADRVFEQAYIPRRLEEIKEYERDHDRLTSELATQVCAVGVTYTCSKSFCNL